jgi:hypothetical protein
MMAEKTKENIKAFTDVVFKWGYIVLICAGFYLKSTFATKEENAEMQKSINGIQNTIELILEREKHDIEQDRRLGNLDDRVRSLEFRRVAGDSKYNQAYPEK